MKRIVIENDTNIIDTCSLVWGSVQINDIQPYEYTIDYLRALFIVRNPAIKGRTLTMVYRTYPYMYGSAIQRQSLRSIEKDIYGVQPSFAKEVRVSGSFSDVFSDATLNSSGSLSRGISLGNTQDMIVNSNLNLQLSGKLSEDVEILANITDENIPIQPEGNTAQLQEFDKVFIQLKYKNIATLIAGDIEKTVHDNYFMKFSKKGQGIMADTRFTSVNKKGKNVNYGVDFSGAVAKGTYVKQQITAIEGNQGPYKLQGKNNELYITVLSGSERVYIDEHLLTRGEDNDYVIDYNSGEITFTARQPITHNKRIVAEYEYVNQDYLRSTVHLNTFVDYDKWKVSFNFYNNQDHKNQTNTLELTDEHKRMLSTLGDATDKAYIMNVSRAESATQEVLYTLKDTMVNGVQYDSIYVYEPGGDSNVYRLGFTMVGANNGDYILQEGVINGRVYVWVAPQGGVPQGNYAPIQMLSTPQREQMYTLGVDYQVHPTTGVHVNMALSNNDKNTFSKADDKDNVGGAVQVKIDNKTPLGRKNPAWTMLAHANYEFRNSTFAYIEDYRAMEFKRNYNLADSMCNRADHYVEAMLDFVHGTGHAGIASNAYFIPEKQYSAIRNELWSQFAWHGFTFNVQASLMNSRQETFNSSYLKHIELLEKELKVVNVGVSNKMEIKQYKTLQGVLMGVSSASNELTCYVHNGDSIRKMGFGVDYINRIEAGERRSVLVTNAIGHQLKAHVDVLQIKGQQLKLVGSYRYFKSRDSIGENTLLANIDYQGRWCRGAIQLGLFYEVGSGMEQKNEYSYLKVAAGQGVYKWIDYNGNNVEELDEFEVAKYKDEADYIRLWRVSDSYVKTYNNQFSASVILRPSAVWRNQSGWKKFMARFANTTTYRSLYKNTLAGVSGMLNPFYIRNNDTNLVTASGMFRNVFSFNQISQIWGIDVVYNSTQTKNLTVNGFEASDVYSCVVAGRVNIKQMFTLNANYENGWNIRESEYMGKNYKIDYNTVSTSLIFQCRTHLKLSINYAYTQKANSRGEEHAVLHNAGLEVNYRILQRGNVYVKGTYYNILFYGNANSSVGYEMLEALQPGHNMVLDAGLQFTLWQNMQLNITYQGRISETEKMKHVAGVELRAFF